MDLPTFKLCIIFITFGGHHLDTGIYFIKCKKKTESLFKSLIKSELSKTGKTNGKITI